MLEAPSAIVSDYVLLPNGIKCRTQDIGTGRERQLAALRPHKAGTPPPRGVGRKPGSKNFATVLREAEPSLAEAYVSHAQAGNGSLLVDSRKVFAPIESDAAPSATVNVLATLVQLDTPRLSPPTLRMTGTDAAPVLSSLTPPSVSAPVVSAGAPLRIQHGHSEESAGAQEGT